MRYERSLPGHLRRATRRPGVYKQRRPNIRGADAVLRLEHDAKRVLDLNRRRLESEQAIAWNQQFVAGARASGELLLEICPRRVRNGGGALPTLMPGFSRSELRPRYYDGRDRAGFGLFVASRKPRRHLSPR